MFFSLNSRSISLIAIGGGVEATGCSTGAILESLRNSHWSHLVVFLTCATRWLHRQKYDVEPFEWLFLAAMAILAGLEPFGCARQKRHRVASMAVAQPGYWLGTGQAGMKAAEGGDMEGLSMTKSHPN
jgi:hypothetical protein